MPELLIEHPETGDAYYTGPLDVWLRFDDPEDEEASHEANTFITEALGFRVEWYHTAVGQVSSQEFDTYEAAAAWLTEAGYQDFTA